MPHRLSAAAQAANDGPDTQTRDLIVITIKALPSNIVLRLATAKVEVDGQEYVGRIRQMPQISNTDGGVADGGEFVIDNSDNAYGPTFLKTDRPLDGSKVVITRAWKLADGTWEHKNIDINPETSEPYNEYYELGSGTLRVNPIDDTAVKCTFVSRMSDSSVVLGGEPILQHCPKTFRKLLSSGPDVYHPNGGPCGWKVSMGGDPDSCDHTPDGPNGCAAHGNTRFGGISALTPRPTSGGGNIPGGISGDGNAPGGGYPLPNRRLPLLDIDARHPFANF